MTDTAVIEAVDISKSFRVPHEKVSSLKGHATRMFKRVPVTRYKVLRDVNFDVKKGEFFSIVGANGSGKSTMLKMLAGIYEPDTGYMQHEGTMSTMIELGVGFNFELSGRDNIFLNASLFGMTRNQIDAVYDKIVRFAEIEDFIDQKVKNYSSGMQVRLAFAIAIQAQSDIMVVDEVLAVGDANFQQKCFDVFRELKAMGKTIVFVSHDLQIVREFSDRVLLLDHGRQVGIFEPLDAIAQYQQLNRHEFEQTDFEPVSAEKKTEETVDRTKPHIGSVDLLDDNGKPLKITKRGGACRVEVSVNNPTKEPIEVGISIVRNDGVYCFGTNTYIEDQTIPREAVCKTGLRFDSLDLQKGAYYIVVGVFSERCRNVYEMRIKARYFRVSQDDKTEGVVNLNHEWKFK